MSITKTKAASRLKGTMLATNTWNFTNSSGLELVVIRGVADNKTPGKEFFEQTLTALATTNGKKSIAAGEAVQFILEGAASLLIARADNLSPVKIVTLAADGTTSNSTSSAVTAADAAQMELAAKFKKLVAAFPETTMAKDYHTVMAGSDPAAADAFFASYPDYATLTLDMVVAVDTYYQVFPYPWIGTAASKTYQLYTSDGTTNKKMGSLVLSNKGLAPGTVEKTAPGFEAVYVSGTAMLPLQYVDAQFVDNALLKQPAICLQGVFLLKTELTGESIDKELVAALAGTINGTAVLGYDEGGTAGGTTSTGTLDKLLPPKTLAGWLTYAGVLIGGIIVLVILAKLMKKAMDAFRNRGTMTQEEYDAVQEAFRQQQAEAMQTSEVYRERLALEKALKLPEKFTDYSAFMENTKVKLSYEADLQHVESISKLQRHNLETALKYGATPSLEKAAHSLADINNWLNTSPDAASVATHLNDVMTAFDTNNALIEAEWKTIRNKQSADMIEMDRAERKIRDFSDSIRQNEKSREEWTEGEMDNSIIVEE